MRVCDEYVYINRKYEFETDAERIKSLELLELIGFYPIGRPYRDENNKIVQEFIRKEYEN